MNTAKRIVQRPWGHRHRKGWVITTVALVNALKQGDVVELDGIQVGTKPLIQLVRLLGYEDCLVRANHRLEIETVARTCRQKNGHMTTTFAKPRHYYNWMGLVNGAWLPKPWMPKTIGKIVVLRPRKY